MNHTNWVVQNIPSECLCCDRWPVWEYIGIELVQYTSISVVALQEIADMESDTNQGDRQDTDKEDVALDEIEEMQEIDDDQE